MFDLASLVGSSPQGIRLQTRARREIPNSQAGTPSTRMVGIFNLLVAKHPKWEIRTSPCGIYNCFGQIWAARRTAIYDQSSVDAILDDDQYRLLGQAEPVRQGDVALYSDEPSGNFLHAGLVCELRGIVDSNGIRHGAPIPWILSKWNDSSGEVVHHFLDVPWPANEFRVRFYTDRQ